MGAPSRAFAALASLAGFAVFMVAFTLVPLVVIGLSVLVLFGSAVSQTRGLAETDQPDRDGTLASNPEPEDAR
jgi:hypothetical protein